MYSSGRAPAATPEQLRESKQSFKNAMAQFGVLDADMVDARRNKRKYKAAYFDNRSGGYYVVQKGHLYNRDELEAAKILALHGLQVVMQPEGDNSGGVSLRVSSSTGRNTYPEGLIGTLWYEQYSTSGLGSGHNSVYKGLRHAHEKGVDVAVIYDKNSKLHRADIMRGIARYKGLPTKTSKTEFKKIYIYNSKTPRRPAQRSL